MKTATMAIAALVISTTAALATPTVEIEGVTFTRTIEAHDTQLDLQGHGLLRYMLFIKAYAGALYLPEGAASGDVLAPVPKRLELAYYHEIAKEDFAEATRVKIADNTTPQEAERLRDRIDTLSAIYRDVQPGDRYALTYLPGRGTELSLNGKSLGTIPGDDFGRAIFAVWLGQNPVDPDFRDTLLGRSS